MTSFPTKIVSNLIGTVFTTANIQKCILINNNGNYLQHDGYLAIKITKFMNITVHISSVFFLLDSHLCFSCSAYVSVSMSALVTDTQEASVPVSVSCPKLPAESTSNSIADPWNSVRTKSPALVKIQLVLGHN